MLTPSTEKEEEQMATENRAVDLLSAGALTPVEAGYLAEGAPRAIGAALAGLAHMGLVEFRSDGKVAPLEPAHGTIEDPVHRMIVGFVTVRPSSVDDIRKAAEPVTEPVRDALRAAGLVLDERALITGGSAIAGGGLATYVGIQILAAANGGVTGHSLLAGLFITAIPTLWLIGLRRRTREGRAVLRRLKEENVALKETVEHAPELVTPTDLARAVAIYGAAILEGGPLDHVGKGLKRERGSCGACGGCGGCGGCGCA
jgi:uncharacterized protein (TIGR04222 family)